ncbi:MAG: peptide deformylase [Xanthomonadales bacterium]|nr:peptide deformylase [Xanthomonadales bacterium]
MAKLEILEFPDPRLRTVAQPVETFDGRLGTLIDDMLETMYGASGIGLAATQVDVHQRVLVMDVSDSRDQPRAFVNPEIVDREGEQVCEEGCLSVPGVYAEVKRANRVKVRAQDRDGETFELELEGLAAVCLQHEMDHLQGKLFVDYLSPLKRQMVRRRLEKQRRQDRVQEPARTAF